MPSLKIRRDSKRRVLHTGESVRANGKSRSVEFSIPENLSEQTANTSLNMWLTVRPSFCTAGGLPRQIRSLPENCRVYPSGSLRKALTGIWNHGLIPHAGISRSMSLLKGILRPEQVSENRHVSVTILSVICLRMRNSETGRCVR